MIRSSNCPPAGELDKAEEVLGVVLPADEDATLPLYPSEETLDEPPSHITAQAPPILSGRLGSVGPVRRDHFDAVLSQLLIQRIAVIGAIADQILRLGFTSTAAPSGPRDGWPRDGFAVACAIVAPVLSVHSTASSTRRVGIGLRPGRPSGICSSGK